MSPPGNRGGRYAARTTVSPAASRDEIERTLTRFGARRFGYVRDDDAGRAAITFEIAQLRVLLTLPLPDPALRRFTHTPAKGAARTAAAAHKAWEDACRESWRALALVIKAKLAAVEAGITTIEREFLAHVQLPDGSVVHDHVMPRIREAYETGGMPQLLPGVGNDGE